MISLLWVVVLYWVTTYSTHYLSLILWGVEPMEEEYEEHGVHVLCGWCRY